MHNNKPKYARKQAKCNIYWMTLYSTVPGTRIRKMSKINVFTLPVQDLVIKAI